MRIHGKVVSGHSFIVSAICYYEYRAPVLYVEWLDKLGEAEISLLKDIGITVHAGQDSALIPATSFLVQM